MGYKKGSSPWRKYTYIMTAVISYYKSSSSHQVTFDLKQVVQMISLIAYHCSGRLMQLHMVSKTPHNYCLLLLLFDCVHLTGLNRPLWGSQECRVLGPGSQMSQRLFSVSIIKVKKCTFVCVCSWGTGKWAQPDLDWKSPLSHPWVKLADTPWILTYPTNSKCL